MPISYILLRLEINVKQPWLTGPKHQILVIIPAILKADLHLVSVSPPSSAFLLLLLSFLCWLHTLILRNWCSSKIYACPTLHPLCTYSLNLPNSSKHHLYDCWLPYACLYPGSHLQTNVISSKPSYLPATLDNLHTWPKLTIMQLPGKLLQTPGMPAYQLLLQKLSLIHASPHAPKNLYFPCHSISIPLIEHLVTHSSTRLQALWHQAMCPLFSLYLAPITVPTIQGIFTLLCWSLNSMIP